MEVYFDDFKVTQVKSPVVQTDDYYLFGLRYNSYSRKNGTEAVAGLVNTLYKLFGLTFSDLYNHEDLSAKTAGEGDVVKTAVRPCINNCGNNSNNNEND